MDFCDGFRLRSVLQALQVNVHDFGKLLFVEAVENNEVIDAI
ncbi:MAG: hypothetical protein ABI042_17580 [Verrucomicrobiota bacterium]